MKNVSKKLFSLMLAAVLLLSVVPFQAFAAEEYSGSVGVRVFVNGVEQEGFNSLSVTGTVENLLSFFAPDYYGALVSFADPSGAEFDADKAASTNLTNGTYTLNFTKAAALNEDPGNEEEPSTGEEKPEDKTDAGKHEYLVTIIVQDWFGKELKREKYYIAEGNTITVSDYGVKAEDFDQMDVNGTPQSGMDVTIKGETEIRVYTKINKDGGNSNNNGNTGNGGNGGNTGSSNTVTLYFTIVDGEKITERKDTATKNTKVDVIDTFLDDLDVDYIVVGDSGERNYNGNVNVGEKDLSIKVYLESRNGGSGNNGGWTGNWDDEKDDGDVAMTLKVYRDRDEDAMKKTFYVEKNDTIDIGELLVAEGIIDRESEVDKIYLNGNRVNPNDNLVKVTRDSTYVVYLDEYDYDEDDFYGDYDHDEDLHKGAGDAFLNIYLEQNLKEPAKRVTINSSAAKDSKITMGEIKEIVKKYFTAKDSDGIEYDGIYLKRGNWKSNWANDTKKYDTINNVNAMRNDGDVTFIVVIDNAKARSSSSADSSNPKTGDSIYVTFTVMTVSAIALAGAYVLNKKRMAR